jgi:kumamolisin
MSTAKKPSYIKLAGSKKAAPEGTDTQKLNPEQSMDVTIQLRPKESIEGHVKSGKRYSREEYEKILGARDTDIQKVEQFASRHHLTIAGIEKARRSVMLRGKVSDFEEAFQVKMSSYQNSDGHIFRGRSGEIGIPAGLNNIVEGVFGLDDRLQTKPMFQVAKKEGIIISHAATQAFWPTDIAKIYGFPANATGQGQTIAIIELGGGYRTKDLKTYFSGLQLSAPSLASVSVDGGKNSPSSANGADGEVMLDIEVAGAIAPGARIVIYFAPNTDQGFLNAITQAIHDTHYKPSVISISWGAAEVNWTQQALTNFNDAFKAASLLGVTICTAAGDQGSADNVTDGKVHVDFPSSSPYVLACGGTRLVATGNAINSETVWHESSNSATGGGVSDFFPLPDYQQNANVPVSLSTGFKGRGLPDVAANADPNTGYKVLVDGQQLVIGGTSAVEPP